MNTKYYIAIMDRALNADIGVRVPCLPGDVESVRKKLYNLRDRLKIKGTHIYDALKFRVYEYSELWIVRKDALDLRDDGIQVIGNVEELHKNDLGTTLRATIKDGSVAVDLTSTTVSAIFFVLKDGNGNVQTVTSTAIASATAGLLRVFR